MKRSEKMRSADKFNIAVITFPFYTEVPKIFIANLLDLLEPLSNEIYAITGNFNYKPNTKIHIISIKRDDVRGSVLRRILMYLLAQPRVTFNLLKISKKNDIVIFYLGTRTYLLPLLVAKLLNKKVVLAVTGSESKGAKRQYGKKLFGLGRIYSFIVWILERIDFHLADKIIIDINVESENLIREFGLTNYRHKVFFGGALTVDVDSFRINKKLKDRKNIIGYIGRHSSEKGVMNFAKAIPLILKERNDLEFIIGSGGPLFEKVKDELKENGSYDKVTFTGWVPREKVPDYFNEMKLIVVPSYTETIPTVIMEAMACGTPVVAAPAVAIPDFIKDGENGFLMENNSPECIAKNVIRALDDPRLDEIVKNAYDLINMEYTHEVVVENYRKLLMEKE